MEPINPKPHLLSLLSSPISVKLKWGMEYRGVLSSVDSYMNLKIEGCEEYIDGVMTGVLGEVFIRCNNVAWIRGLDKKGVKDEGSGDMEE